MQAVILAGGKGVRMRPLTDTLPKPLVPLWGRTLLDHVLERLPVGVTEIVVVVKYRGAQIRAHVGDVYRGVPVVYVEQGEPDGTGGALAAARGVLRERFLVVNADDLHERAALEELCTYPYALLAAESDTPERFGVLSVREDGILLTVEEKPAEPASNLVNTGAMVLDHRVFAYHAPLVGVELRLTDLVMQLAADVPVRVVRQRKWCSVGTLEELEQVNGEVCGLVEQE